MWRLLEYLLAALIVLLAITEFFYPLISGKPFFGSFRKKPTVINSDPDSLNTKVDQAKQKVNEVKEVQREVDEHYKSAEQLKEEADALLKKQNDRTNNNFNNN